MHHPLRYFAATALASGALAVCQAASAADTNARDFFSAPPGTSLGVLYLPVTQADSFHSRAGDVGPADLKVEAVAYRHVWFSDICGTLCTPQFIVPAAHIEARLPGSAASESLSGVGDPQVGGTLFFVNNPDKREYAGLLSLLTLPVGRYDARHADVSPGANRWGGTFLLNYTRGVGKNWVLEGSLETQIYGVNDDYHGGSLKQKPLYRLQAFASYDFTPATYGALRLYYAEGGALRLNGQDLPYTRQRYTQLGFELGHWLDRQNQLMVTVAKNVQSENTYDAAQAMLRLVHVY
ncbi:transporter [Pseudogulbenkiania ferrooxidans]|uniref:Protein QbdB n=1 Tax=Pseudogulbenkiania ferrooxidans 2002 TaxID=279714 RepID=B9Z412_9NEIS|nr:transporter [Pseudogulbenkiania ferrooxidans]EEG08589.1 conserved hypothetical protein [Pseudogulbenkiania ferrooxidans 2002]